MHSTSQLSVIRKQTSGPQAVIYTYMKAVETQGEHVRRIEHEKKRAGMHGS